MFDTNVFQFRVANKMFGSNSERTNRTAKDTCNRMGVNGALCAENVFDFGLRRSETADFGVFHQAAKGN